MAQPKRRRFRLDRDTGITVYIPSRPEGIRLEPGSHYTTDRPDEIEALQSHADLTEVKVPKRDG